MQRCDAINDQFQTLVRTRPDHLLVLSPSRTATVADIEALTGRLGQLLRTVEPGQLVGLAAANGPAFLAGFLALLRRGCTVLLFDWRTPDVERRRIADSLGASGVLRCATGWPDGAGAYSWDVGDASAAQPLPDISPGVALLTSGSTGTPQAIIKTVEAELADDDALAYSMGLVPEERILAAVPMSHSYGLGSTALPALRRGSQLVVPDEGNPLATVQAVVVGEVSFLPTVPAYLQAILKMASPPPLPESLRLVITAGAPIQPATAARFREVYGHQVHVLYGASEVGGICFDREGGAAERGALGIPVEGVSVSLEPAEGYGSSDRGVVTVRSPAAGITYYPVPDPRLANGVFTSSDLGTFRDGELVLLGRIDDLINIKGKKVDPGEVAEIIGDIDGVDEVVVLGVPQPVGAGEMVRAVIACEPGRVGYDQVLSRCRVALAAHKVPRSIILVRDIPRTARGKIDRTALLSLQPDDHG